MAEVGRQGTRLGMKVALLCDVDQLVYHVGDEAIFTAEAAELRRRGHDVVRISRHESYGPRSAHRTDGTIPALTFPWGLEDRTRYLAEIRGVLSGDREALPAQDKLFGIIEDLRAVDALVIGGGGSLNSRYGWLLSERLATALVARHLGKPVILSGQSIGPFLQPGDRELVAELIDVCDLVGLRDASSVQIARTLQPDHAAIMCIPDDAHLLLAAHKPRDVIAATVAGDPGPLGTDAVLSVVGAVVGQLAEKTGAVVELVPHMGLTDPEHDPGHDVEMHRSLADLIRRRNPTVTVENCGLEVDRDSARRTATAQWVVSTRFHPVVFALGAGAVPLALPVDVYGRARIEGALLNAGLTNASVPLAALWDPVTQAVRQDLVERVVAETVATRGIDAQARQARSDALARASRTWWDVVECALPGAETELAPRELVPVVTPVSRWSADLRSRLARYTDDGADLQPAVSVVMRTKDRSVLLDRAVADVLAQTRTDWELVIVNDVGDITAVREVLGRYEHLSAGRIRVLDRDSSTGMESASNAGIAASSAPLLAIHDDDDTWSPTFLQETVEALSAQLERDAVAVRIRVIHEREVEGVLEDEWSHLLWADFSGIRLLEMMLINRTVPIAVVYRRRLHDEIGLYDEDLPVIGDYEFFLRVLQRGEFLFIDRELAFWRHRRDADGASENSMYAMGAQHTHMDRELRDRYLREWTNENGLGLPMFLAHTMRTELRESTAAIEHRLGEIERTLATLSDRHSVPVAHRLRDRVRTTLPEPVKRPLRRVRDAARRLRQHGD